MDIVNRKDQHVKYAKEEKIEYNDFDNLILEHVSIPSFDVEDVNLSTSFLGQTFKYPFYINAMTGGSAKTKIINEKLALYAKTFNLPLVLGSQSAALKNSELISTYDIVRKINPKGFIIGNVSANANIDDALRAIQMIKADALSIHVNVIQELVMSEGDRKFKHWKENIKDIVEKLNKPVLVKEVGFGMSKKTINELIEIGVKYLDVSGMGGTNFARIERKRNNDNDFTFENVGISTVKSLKNAENLKLEVYASGGIRNALDIFKALYLGAKAVGLSRFFLLLTEKDDEEAFKIIETLIENLKKCFVIFGYKDLNELHNRRED
ncbi:type 2 isopentenyl-diphosphate Delta-isomerase [Haploplasma axanthum]|uniref:Isopentenyl-diphosphate delta-isomerase n=1 Tax=Haploplasma axanthum TaxID=29552 RepID=A0A449BF13_HAPAX|nr:type 2 isopentenyl-diphosphate Delta-isomerase [Haploplasma axanthum]VEU81018.1 Isopentenyl-diphosphate delta-isomerase [Haploplasma axanthum]